MNIRIDNEYIQSCVYRLRYVNNQPVLASDVIIGSYTDNEDLAAEWWDSDLVAEIATLLKGEIHWK